MSRASDYEFISANTEAIESEVSAMYTALTGREARASSPEMLFIKWISSVLVQSYTRINIAGNQNIPSRATGDNLDALGELYFDKTRPSAQAATVNMRFTISQAQSSVVVIPQGTRVAVSGGSVVFATEADAHIPIGETTAEVRCKCEETGTVGNGIPAGSIITCVDPFPYYSTCVNLDESGGGADAATDDEYYDLMVASEDAYSCAGARGAYEYWAKSVSTEIGDVRVNSPSAGQVNIYVLMKDGSPAGAEIKAAVLAACNEDEARPLTDYVVVDDPDEVTFDVNLTYYISRSSTTSAAEIQTAVNNAVDDYIKWQTAKIGRDLNPSKLIQMVVAAGAKRVVVTYPVYTHLEDGSNNSTPELAVLGSKTVTNGGYEDD